MHLEDDDDTRLPLNAVPYTAPNGETVFTDDLSGWKHVGETWVDTMIPDLVNSNKKARTAPSPSSSPSSSPSL